MHELDPEEMEAARNRAGEYAATHNGTLCAGMQLRPVNMATYVMLTGTGNGFWSRGASRRRLAAFDAAAFVWMHAAPEAEVFSCDWQDASAFTAAVTRWMRRFTGKEILELAQVAKRERDAYLASEFRILPDPMATEKKSRSGQGARSDT